MNGKIYMRISPSGSRYIGQTVKDEEKRWKQHVQIAYNKNSEFYNLPLSRAIRKYGAENFCVEILETYIETKEKLDEREKYWIKEKHSLVSERKGGLNVAIGGKGHVKFTDDDFRKLYNDGLSIYEISQITGAHSATVRAHLGSNNSENSRRNRLRVLKLNPPKSVSCYDVNTCEKVMTFASTAEASLHLAGDRQGSRITNAISGKCASAFGYLWKYDEQPMDIVYEHYKRYHKAKNNNTRGISVVNIETGEVFKSALSAAKKYNIKQYKIIDCCNGEQDEAAGFHWRFENEEYKKYTKQFRKAVICIETNIEYPSVSEASRQTGIYINSITACLKGRRESVKGYHWKYKDPSVAGCEKHKNNRFKPVICLETGKVFDTMAEAASYANVGIYKFRTHIKTDGIINGLHWKFCEEQVA